MSVPQWPLGSHSAQMRALFFQAVSGGKDDEALMKSTHHFFMVQEAAGRLLGSRGKMGMLSFAFASSLMP